MRISDWSSDVCSSDLTRGSSAGSIYGNGSRMRLLEDNGMPCGSIAVSARADGRPYTQVQERMLEAPAQRVSSTLHRLSLFTDVQGERRTLSDILASSRSAKRRGGEGCVIVC